LILEPVACNCSVVLPAANLNSPGENSSISPVSANQNSQDVVGWSGKESKAEGKKQYLIPPVEIERYYRNMVDTPGLKLRNIDELKKMIQDKANELTQDGVFDKDLAKKQKEISTLLGPVSSTSEILPYFVSQIPDDGATNIFIARKAAQYFQIKYMLSLLSNQRNNARLYFLNRERMDKFYDILYNVARQAELKHAYGEEDVYKFFTDNFEKCMRGETNEVNAKDLEGFKEFAESIYKELKETGLLEHSHIRFIDNGYWGTIPLTLKSIVEHFEPGKKVEVFVGSGHSDDDYQSKTLPQFQPIDNENGYLNYHLTRNPHELVVIEENEAQSLKWDNKSGMMVLTSRTDQLQAYYELLLRINGVLMFFKKLKDKAPHKSDTNGSASSPVTPQAQKAPGGIDFRALPIVTQAIGNLSANISHNSMQEMANMNLRQEWSDIERMVNAGITPSSERIKEYLQASCSKGNVDNDIDKVISCISDILRQEEECCHQTDATLKDILVVLESTGSGAELNKVFLR